MEKQKNKLAEKFHTITKKVKDKEEKEEKNRIYQKKEEINKKIKSILDPRIKNILEKIEKTAQDGKSYIQISALESDDIEIHLLNAIQNWANEQGFGTKTSYNEIYESPRSSDDLPSDTRYFLTINWE